jgi:hypothetical protein
MSSPGQHSARFAAKLNDMMLAVSSSFRAVSGSPAFSDWRSASLIAAFVTVT